MPNPGPATTVSTNYLFTGESTDGIQLGASATDLVGFHGAVPSARQGAITDLASNATSTAIATAVNAIITVLEVKGLVAPN